MNIVYFRLSNVGNHRSYDVRQTVNKAVKIQPEKINGREPSEDVFQRVYEEFIRKSR